MILGDSINPIKMWLWWLTKASRENRARLFIDLLTDVNLEMSFTMPMAMGRSKAVFKSGNRKVIVWRRGDRVYIDDTVVGRYVDSDDGEEINLEGNSVDTIAMYIQSTLDS